MPYNMLLTEKQNNSSVTIVYVKSSELSDIVRVDSSLKPTKNVLHFCKSILCDVFLPREFPYSVSKDYVSYQIWDTVQASCSTISNTLVTKTVLEGLGVGDHTATSVGATITWILKEGSGKLAGITFAWLSSCGLDAQCKKWRLFADVINDIAIMIELIMLPLFPNMALRILCLSTTLKALVGVAGGATRAAITQHQAIKQNMADVSAKDGSQETCVNLIGSLLSAVILLTVTSSSILWYLYILMTFLHLYANYKAVKSLNFNTFNKERLLLILEEYLKTDIISLPVKINQYESVFLGFGFSDKKLCGFKIQIGYSFEEIMKNVSELELLLSINMYRARRFMIFIIEDKKSIFILLHAQHTAADLVECYYRSVLLGIGCSYINECNLDILKDENTNSRSIINKFKYQLGNLHNKQNKSELLLLVDQFASNIINNFLNNVVNTGWDIERHLLSVGRWRANWYDHGQDEKKLT